MASSSLPGARSVAPGAIASKIGFRLAVRQPVPLAFTSLTVLSQVLYPLSSGDFRNRLTVLTVLLWCAASLTHAVVTRGPRFAAGLFAVSAGVGFGAEVIGVATSFPFGSYTYASTLGARVGGVPVIVPLAWVMMAYPALLVGRRIGAPVLGGALALASWDLFLDPQMVSAGHWHFTGSGPTLNAIPVSNTLGWIGVSLLIMALLARIPVQPREGPHPAQGFDDRIPLGLYLWTYASSVLAALVFFHHPGVALLGGVAMGIPVALLLNSGRMNTRRITAT